MLHYLCCWEEKTSDQNDNNKLVGMPSDRNPGFPIEIRTFLIGAGVIWVPKMAQHAMSMTLMKSIRSCFYKFLSEALNFYRMSPVQLLCFSFGRIFCRLSTRDDTVHSGIPETYLEMVSRISIGKCEFLSDGIHTSL